MEDKTIQQIKDEVAKSFGYTDSEEILYKLKLSEVKDLEYLDYEQCVINTFARQQCELQKAQCADEAGLHVISKGHETFPDAFLTEQLTEISVSKKSILTAKNVCDAR